MLTLWAGQAESLWDDALAVVVRGAAGRSGGAGRVACRSGVARADRGALASGGCADAAGGVDRWAPDDRDGDLRPVDGPQAALPLGVQDACGGGVGLDSSAQVLSNLSLSERVPDESTVRKLTRRIGAETVNELTRVLIVKATREKRFCARAVRIDSTVIEADVRYPTDAGLAAHGVRALAREARELGALVAEQGWRVRDR